MYLGSSSLNGLSGGMAAPPGENSLNFCAAVGAVTRPTPSAEVGVQAAPERHVMHQQARFFFELKLKPIKEQLFRRKHF